MDSEKQPCIVLWEKGSRETFAYPAYAETDEEALRKAAGVFMKLHDGDKNIFTKARNEAVVYWQDNPEYEKYIDLARKFRKLYEEKRNRGKVERTLQKTEKKQNPLPAFTARRKRKKRKTDKTQIALF